MAPADEAACAAEIFRRWRRTSLDVLKRSRWENSTLEDAWFLESMVLLVLLLLLEPALWFQGWPPVPVFLDRGGGWLVPSLLALPVHGWLLDSLLSARTPGERRMPRWLLILRFVAASLPMFSIICLLPAWQVVLERRPAWAFPASRPGLPLNLAMQSHPVRPAGRSLRRLYTSGAFAAWASLAFALPLLWAFWLAKPGSLGPARRPVLLALCTVLHLIAFVGMRLSLRPMRNAPHGAILRLLPWFWLLPLPGPLMGLIAHFSLGAVTPGGETLTWSAWARRGTARRLPSWLAIEETLQNQWRPMPWFRQWQRPWGIDRKAIAGQIEVSLLSLYRLKTALLLLEGGVLVAVLSILVDWFPGIRPAASAVLHAATYLAIALAGLGVAALSAFGVARLLRVPGVARSNFQLSGRYLLLTQAAFLAGTQGGFLWVEGRMRELGLLILFAGILLALLGWLFFLPAISSSQSLRSGLLWIAFFLALAVSGIPVGLSERLGGWPGLLLGGAALLTPLWSLLLFRQLGNWLPRPFSWHALWDRRLPGRLRGVLAFLGLTAAAPWGGLAIPVWIALRSYLMDRWRERPDLLGASSPQRMPGDVNNGVDARVSSGRQAASRGEIPQF